MPIKGPNLNETYREKINLQKCYRLFAELLGRSSIIPILFLLLTS